MTSLDREGRVFSRYLLGEVADGRIPDLYRAAVETGTAGPFPELRPFERLLARLARFHPAATRAVDIYARHFFPAAPVRKRLILMLAILESHAVSYAIIDTVDGGGRPLVLVRLVAAGCASLLLLALAVTILTPLRLALASRGSGD